MILLLRNNIFEIIHQFCNEVLTRLNLIKKVAQFNWLPLLTLQGWICLWCPVYWMGKLLLLLFSFKAIFIWKIIFEVKYAEKMFINIWRSIYNNRLIFSYICKFVIFLDSVCDILEQFFLLFFILMIVITNVQSMFLSLFLWLWLLMFRSRIVSKIK